MIKRVSTLVFAVSFALTSFGQSWTSLADMPASLTFPVVVALNGNIHVIGGGGANGATDLHLRYKPSTDKWDTLAPVPYLAQQPGGAVLNGKIHYLGGGYPNSGSRLDNHYSYNPTTNKWTQELDVPIPRVIHKVVTLGDSMFVLTGQPEKARVDVYIGSTKKWIQLSNLPDNNFWYSATTEYDGTIYRFGGGGSNGSVDDSHKYDVSKDQWSGLAAYPMNCHAPAGTRLGDSILITGGYSNFKYIGRSYFYNPSSDQYNAGPFLPEGSAYHSMVTIDDCAYVVGGHNSASTTVKTQLLRYCKGDDFASMDLVEPVVPAVWTYNRNIYMQSVTEGTIKLYNLKGVLVLERKINVGETTLTPTMHQLEDGLYIVDVNGRVEKLFLKED